MCGDGDECVCGHVHVTCIVCGHVNGICMSAFCMCIGELSVYFLYVLGPTCMHVFVWIPPYPLHYILHSLHFSYYIFHHSYSILNVHVCTITGRQACVSANVLEVLSKCPVYGIKFVICTIRKFQKNNGYNKYLKCSPI